MSGGLIRKCCLIWKRRQGKNNFALFTYHDDTIITDTPENEHIQNEARLNNLKVIKEEEFSVAIDFAPCKCMLVSDDEEALVSLEGHWKRRLNGALDVFRSEPYFLEVVPCAIDKANTLGALLEELDVKREEVIAIGDGVCDVTMIQLAGLGVAMGHSQDSVKVCADYVTAPMRKTSGSGCRKGDNSGSSRCRDSFGSS